MISPEASDFTWIFVVKPPRDRPSACPSCPPLLRPPTQARARRWSRTSEGDAPWSSWTRARRKRLRKRRPCSPIEASPHAVPGTEALRQSAPANVLAGEEMKRLEEATVVLGFPTATGQAGPEHRKRVRPIVLIHLCRHRPRPLIQSESYESCLIQPRNPKNSICPKFVHTA